MGGHPFPEIPCTICGQFVDLTVDLSADEHGKAVHEACYGARLTRACTAAALEQLFNTLKVQPSNLHCPQCGLTLSQANATFFLENGKGWKIPLPVCMFCNPGDTLAGSYMDA
jgi:hypothetical protein